MYVIRFHSANYQYGPFKSAQAADTWAKKNLDGAIWYIQRLVKPERLK